VASAGHRLLAHTADTIIEAWGPTPAACLEQAVLGLVSAFAEPRPGAAVAEVAFRLDPRDRADLPLALLDEVVYLLDTRGVVPVGVDFDGGDAAGPTGRFRVVDTGDVELVGAVPKAVARSGYVFGVGTDGTWRCRVTVDV